MDMTLAQARIYAEAAGRSRRHRMRDDVVAALAGARYDERGLKKLLKELDK